MSSPRWKPYPRTKDSGVKWLGQIPAHWDLQRLKYMGRFTGGGTPSKSELSYWDGSLPWVSPKDMKCWDVLDTEDHITEQAVLESATEVVLEGALLIVVRSGILRHTIPVAVSRCRVALNQDMKALVMDDLGLVRYCMYIIAGKQRELLAEWRSEGATVESLEFPRLARTAFPVPPAAERAAVVDFLDRETAKIDALVEKKERLIDLLQEKRAALITHAVTKGLDPDVPMKDSGIEWLGQIPAHWRLSPLKHVAYMKGRLGWQNLTAAEYTDEGPYLVASEQFEDDIIQWERCPHVDQARYEIAPEIQIRERDVLFMKDGAAMGKLAYVERLPGNACLSSHLLLLRPLEALCHPRFLYYILKSRVFETYMKCERTGTTFFGFKQESMGNYLFFVVSGHEQEEIVRHLDQETSRIDALIGKVREAIERLREYRTALISAAVTGKIDVRGV